MRDSVKEMSEEELQAFDEVDADGFVAWAYLESAWLPYRYREYLQWCGLNHEEIRERMIACGFWDREE